MQFEAPRWMLVGVALLGVVSACQRATDDVRPWQPSDHDQPPTPSPAQVPAVDKSEVATTLQKHGINDVALLAWKQRCVTCHGLVGRGDGPSGAASGARDLSDPLWQRNTSDEQIARSITTGKGAMPRFDLPESTVTALVQLVRLIGQGSSRPETSADPVKSPPATGSSAGPATSSNRPLPTAGQLESATRKPPAPAPSR